MIARVLRALVVLVLLLATPLALAPPVSAHASQTGSDPAADAVLESGPAAVTVTFDSPLMDVGAALVVTAADGTVVSDSAPVVAADAITVAMPTDAPPGVYTVAYRVVSEDGHTVTAAYTYTVQGAAAPTAGAAPTVEPPSPAGSDAPTSSAAAASTAPAPGQAAGPAASSGVVLGVLAVLLVLIVGFAVLLVLRSRPRS